jgi:hypothetical protein
LEKQGFEIDVAGLPLFQVEPNYPMTGWINFFTKKGINLLKAHKPIQNGGIDLSKVKIDSRISGNDNEGIKFHLDPAQLQQLQNAPGFVPVIINIQPMTDLRLFLGLADNSKKLPAELT